MVETRLLHYFLTVARERNITNAAKALHITQPTLSRQMALLEHEIGAPVLKRPTEVCAPGAVFRKWPTGEKSGSTGRILPSSTRSFRSW